MCVWGGPVPDPCPPPYPGAEPCRVPRPDTRLLIGAENVVCLRARATNAGEGAFEAELRVQLPEDTYYQKALSNIQVGGGGGTDKPCPWCRGGTCSRVCAMSPPCCSSLCHRRGRRS